MRQPIQFAPVEWVPIKRGPGHAEVTRIGRLALQGDRSGSTAPGRGSVHEGLWGVAVAGFGFLVWLACAGSLPPPPATAEKPAPFIVQATDLATALEAVREVGGEVTHELAVIRAVGARLTPSQRAALEAWSGITRVWEDRPVCTQAQPPTPRNRPSGGAKDLEVGE